MGFNQVFGGTPIAPSSPGYEAVTLTTDVTLAWPIETIGGVPLVAGDIDVTAPSGGKSLIMPDATQGSPGVICLMANVGANAFALKDNTGTPIVASIAASQQWLIILTSNATQAGVWRAYQLAATTSTANAAALAGAGLEVNGSMLRVRFPVVPLAVNTLLDQTYRADAVKWTAGAGTLSFDTAANLTNGWFAFIVNAGSAALTLSPTGGALINGQASISIPKGTAGQLYSALVICDGTNLEAFGLVPSPTAIANGGTGANTAGQALINLGGTTIGIGIFTAPNAAAVIALLGLGTSTFTERTVSTNQTLNTSSSSTALVCTAALQVSLPLTSTVTTGYYFGVYAQGGNVTVKPALTDAINGLAAGASFVLARGSSAIFVTDAAGNWWPLILAGSGLTWTVAGGAADAITATYVPANTALYDGLILNFRATAANATAAPTFAPDGLTAHAITKGGGQPLNPGDIPGNLAEASVRYNLANTRWELLNPATIQPPWAVATGTVDAITVAYTPAIVTLYDGLVLNFRATGANASTTPTFSPNALTAHTITKQGGNPLSASDIPGNLAEMSVRYNLANTRWELQNPASSIISGTSAIAGGAGSFSALKITAAGGAKQATATANSILVSSGVSNVALLAFNKTVDISVNGANGLDTGAAANTTIYYLFAIWNGSTATAALLASLSPTAPTMPAGYTYKNRIGAFLTDGSANILGYTQFSTAFRFLQPVKLISGVAGTWDGATPTWDVISTSAVIPPTVAQQVLLSQNTYNGFGSVSRTSLAPNSAYLGGDSTTYPSLTQGNAERLEWLNTLNYESSNVYWAAGGGGGLWVAGWNDNL